jgi:hypothetical protein
MRAAFGVVLRVPSEDTNTVLVAGGEDLRPASFAPAVATLPAELRPRAQLDAEVVADGLKGGSVYTDDKAPVEWLVDASLIGVAADGEEE